GPPGGPRPRAPGLAHGPRRGAARGTPGSARVRVLRSTDAAHRHVTREATMRGHWLLLLFGLLAGPPAVALAHDVGVIRLGVEEATAGSELEIRGEKLSKNTEFTLVLRGALETHTLGKVRSDSAGVFTVRIALPASASPGAYVVRVLAPDGDESARAELRLLPAVPPSAPVD